MKSVRQEYVNHQKANMYSKTREGISKYEQACEKVKVLNCFREEEEYIKQRFDDKGTLRDIIRKQNISRGLTHIPDDLYKFFVVLNETCQKLLVNKNVNSYDASLYEFCIRSIINTESLRDEFITIVNKYYTTVDLAGSRANQISIPSSVTIQLSEAISRKFLSVMLNQFRSDLLQSFRISKAMAHRKQIQVKKQKQEARKLHLNMSKMTSEKNEMSHSLMRGLILGKVDVLTDMKKNKVLKLCLAYNVKVPSKARKSEITDKLSQAILSSMEMGHPGTLCEEPPTSQP